MAVVMMSVFIKSRRNCVIFVTATELAFFSVFGLGVKRKSEDELIGKSDVGDVACMEATD